MTGGYGRIAIVEIGEISGHHIDRAKADADVAPVQQLEIDEGFQRIEQRSGIVETGETVGIENQLIGRKETRREEARNAEQGRHQG